MLNMYSSVGSLLGDVFLHLLPETWAHVGTDQSSTIIVGMSVVSGFLFFLLIEKIFPDDDDDDIKKSDHYLHQTEQILVKQMDNMTKQRHVTRQNGLIPENDQHKEITVKKKIKTMGWLNLLANVMDNFTHGLAIGGSFAVSHKVGYTSFASIVLHEIPHELGDFAILLKAGFTRQGAAKVQFITATAGVFGAVFALYSSSVVDT
ncbi:unnamed protein product, partial [Didymodactylos carnosus]